MASYVPPSTSADDYSTKEKFILACCVSRSGEGNWVSCSRTMKLITEACGDEGENRPADWFSQKNCATKYNQLLNTAFAIKRKVRGQNSDSINVETPAEQILRKLTFKRIEELDQAIKAERERYKKLKSDIEKIQGGLIDDQLPQIWNAIQRGDTLLEDVIKCEPVEAPAPKISTHTITNVHSAVPIIPSRPQRVTKETEKFKSYIEQRQKHNAKYHHHSASSSSAASSSSSTTTSATHASSLGDISIINQPISTATISTATGGVPHGLPSATDIPYEPNVVVPSQDEFPFLQEVEQQPKTKQRSDSQQKLHQQQILLQKQQQTQEQQQQLLLLQRQQQLKQFQQPQSSQQQQQQQQQQLLLQQQLQEQEEQLQQERLVQQQQEEQRQLEEAQFQKQQLELQKQQQEEAMQLKVQQELIRQQQEEEQRQQMEEKRIREEKERKEEEERLADEMRREEQLRVEEHQKLLEEQAQQQALLQKQKEDEERKARLEEERRKQEEQAERSRIQHEEEQRQLQLQKQRDEEEKAKVKEQELKLQQEKEEKEKIEKEQKQLSQKQKQKQKRSSQLSQEKTEKLTQGEELERQKLLQKQQQLELEYKQQLELHQKQQQQKLQKKQDKKKKKNEPTVIDAEDNQAVGKVGDGSDSSCLSSLLSAPTKEIKAQVDQISEVLKEPIKNPHHVSKEAYEAYKSVQPPSPSTQAPVLSKLLESTTSPQQGPCKTSDSQHVVRSTRSKKSPITQSTITQFFDPTEEKDKSKTYPLFSPSPSDNESPSGEPKRFPKVDSELYTNLFSSTESTPSNETFNITSPIKAIVGKTSPTPFTNPLVDKSETAEEKPDTFPAVDEEEKRPPEDSLTVDVGEMASIAAETSDDGGNDTNAGTLLEVVPAKRTLETYGANLMGASTDQSDTGEDMFTRKNQPPSAKKKKAGRRSKKKENPMKIDILDAVKALELGVVSDEERKLKTPLTPGEPSPASPALSTGSNCGDPETAHQQRAWRKSIMLVWKAAASHKFANIFLHAVTDEEAPGYSSIIFRPMDLSSIKKNIETGVITTTVEFQRDIMLMFQNALMYNRREHDVYQMAREMRNDVLEQIQSYISAQMMVQSNDAKAAGHAGHTRHSSKANFPLLSL